MMTPIRIIAAAAALALVATPALAQKKTDEQKKAEAERRKQDDQAYRASIQNIPDQNPAALDPWNNMRGDTPADGKKPRR